MKILITTDLFTTATNGVVTSVRNLWNELKAGGHEVRILTLSDTAKSHKDGAVYYIRSIPIGVYPNVRMPTSYRHRLIRELIDWQPNVIHSQCEFFTFQYALRISKLTNTPIVHTYHTLYERYVTYVIPFERFGRCAVRFLVKKRLKRVKTVVVPTRKAEETLRGYGMENKLRVVPTGIDLEQHQRRITPAQRAEKRKALGIADGQTVLLSLGRLGTEKNLEELLHYFSDAIRENDRLIFLIVGDGPAKEQLQKLSAALGISGRVIFTGMVQPSEVQDYYQLGDLFVSASTSETQGLTYIEAAANGLPLLCRRDPCLKDVIIQGQNGYEYTCEREFLDALHIAVTDHDWSAAAGKRSQEVAAAFDRKAFGAAMEEIYESLL